MPAKRVESRPKKQTTGGGREDKLPAAELDVMASLWKNGEATARAIREDMLKFRPMAHGSVVTLLTRLEAKGLVSRQKGKLGKAFLFRPTRSAEATHRALLRGLVSRVFAGDSVQMIAALFEACPPTNSELDQIAGLVAAQRRSGRSIPGQRRN